MKKEKKVFNVILYNWNNNSIEQYNVLTYFRNVWESKKYNFDKKEVTNKETLKEWIKRVAKYMYWSRCEYEFLIAPWPYNIETLTNDMVKIDVYEQIMNNINIITDILYEEFNINKSLKINENNCNHIIGQMNMTYDDVRLITMEDLIQYQPHTVYSMEQLLNGKYSTNLTHFNHCPICGTKINWSKLKKEY